MDGDRLDQHLAGCGQCRRWLIDAVRVTRAVRLQRADVPDLTASILARAREDAPPRGAATRAALFAVAAGQAAVAVPALTGMDTLGSVPVHSAHELGAFNLALAAAFGWTAWKPRRARAHLPLLATLVVVLTGLTIVDVILERVAVAVEAGHLLLIAGFAMTMVLARGEAQPNTPPPDTAPAADDGAPWREAA